MTLGVRMQWMDWERGPVSRANMFVAREREGKADSTLEIDYC